MAMTIQDYEQRIAKSEEKLLKIEKKIKKWEDNKSDKNFAKHFDWLQDDVGWHLGWDGDKRVYGTYDEFKIKKYKQWEDECNQEIKYANREKEDTITIINKYKNAIALLQEKDSKPVIQIFKDFFNRWKEEIKEYVKPWLDTYYKLNSKINDLYNHRFSFEDLGFKTKQEYKEKLKELEERESDIKNDAFVRVAIEKRYKYSEEEFNKYLNDYMNDRYFELVDKVTNIVGQIEDVSDLHVGHDGRLNGKVFGNLGGAKIETIRAGGYNDNIIVNVKRGQCLHYRVLVHPIK